MPFSPIAGCFAGARRKPERTKPLAGNEIIPAAERHTRAITIAARLAEIWPWLVQMSQDRAGFYSHDRLERLFGAGIHNADRVVPAWQQLRVGDLVKTYRDVPGRSPLGWRVRVLEPERALVFCDEHEAWCWTLALEPIDRYTTRLISREHRLTDSPGKRLLLAIVFGAAHFVMDTGVFRGVKKRVERAEGVTTRPRRDRTAADQEP